MYGDSSRPLIHPTDGVTRVLFNQGQPLVDADLNNALLALQEQNRMLVRAFKPTGEEKDSFAFGDGFKVVVDGEGLTIKNGFYSLAGNLVEKRDKKNRYARFVELNSKWLIDFVVERSDNNMPQEGTSVWLNVRERPSYKKEDNPFHTSIQPAEYLRREWYITLEKTNEGVESGADAPELCCTVNPQHSHLIGPLLNLEFDLYKAKPFWKLATDNAPQTCSLSDEVYAEGTDITIPGSLLSNFDSSLMHGDMFVEVLQPSIEEDLVLQSRGHLFQVSLSNKSLTLKALYGETLPTIAFKENALLRFWAYVWSAEGNETQKPLNITAQMEIAKFEKSDSWHFVGKAASVQSKPDSSIIKGNRSTFRAMLAKKEGQQGEFGDKRSHCTFGTCVIPVTPATPSTEEPAQTDDGETAAPATDGSTLIKSLPGLPLADLNTSSAVRRWLASMTMAELSDLSAEEICRRITNDCRLNRGDEVAVRSDIDRLVIKRDQLRRDGIFQYA